MRLTRRVAGVAAVVLLLAVPARSQQPKPADRLAFLVKSLGMPTPKFS